MDECVAKLKEGTLAPWKVENELESSFGIIPPHHFGDAALCRQRFIEDVTGASFKYIQVPEKPYKARYRCPRDELIWELDARDDDHTCSLCGGSLDPLGQYLALVANYVGGAEIYFSYAGRIHVKGDIDKVFTNLLVYGTGLGPIGVTRGCHLVNRLGGVEVKVEERSRAVRCNGYIFKSDSIRSQARRLIEENLAKITADMEAQLSEFSGRISSVDFKQVDKGGDHILFIDFVGSFEHFRGHGDISRAVGFAKEQMESLLQEAGIDYELSVIAQGHDGDLKPSPKNKRGRKAAAEIRIPAKDFEDMLKVHPEKFCAFVRVDTYGAEELGCQFYSGMGGEIIPAVYKATQVNPQSPLVSSFQNNSAVLDKGDVVFRVELFNVEVGIASCREGLISPVGREALRIMGVHTAREFAASLVAQVLAGEFNLALEISREKLYSSR